MRDAEVGVGGLAVVAQLVERAPDEVDRARRSPTPSPPPPVDWIWELIPSTRPFGVEQRAAGVAVVDRGVGLDRAGDLEVAGRASRSCGPSPRSRRPTATAARRTASRSRPRAAPTCAGRSLWPSGSGSQASGPSGSTLISATSALGSKPTILAGTSLPSREAHEDLARALERRAAAVGDDVGVRGDLAVAGDDEARSPRPRSPWPPPSRPERPRRTSEMTVTTPGALLVDRARGRSCRRDGLAAAVVAAGADRATVDGDGLRRPESPLEPRSRRSRRRRGRHASRASGRRSRGSCVGNLQGEGRAAGRRFDAEGAVHALGELARRWPGRGRSPARRRR